MHNNKITDINNSAKEFTATILFDYKLTKKCACVITIAIKICAHL